MKWNSYAVGKYLSQNGSQKNISSYLLFSPLFFAFHEKDISWRNQINMTCPFVNFDKTVLAFHVNLPFNVCEKGAPSIWSLYNFVLALLQKGAKIKLDCAMKNLLSNTYYSCSCQNVWISGQMPKMNFNPKGQKSRFFSLNGRTHYIDALFSL